MSDIRRLAIERLSLAEAEVASWRSFIETYDHLAADSGAPACLPKARARYGCATPQKGILAACLAVLKAERRPMRAGELRRAIEDAGVVVDGASPKSRVVTALWRSRPLVVHTSDGYVLSEWLAANDPQREAGASCDQCGKWRSPGSAGLCRVCYVTNARAMR